MKRDLKNATSLYSAIDDEEIIKEAKSGDLLSIAYIIEKYKRFVGMKSRNYFLIGGDNDDVFQEGLLGLYKAILDYDHGKEASFKVFAEICVTRQILSAINGQNRKKHFPLNNYISLDRPLYGEDSDLTLGNVISEGECMNPEHIYIVEEELSELARVLKNTLTKLEKNVLYLYLEGKSYKEIGACLNKETKAIDNALQRVKNKAQTYMSPKWKD